MNEKQLASKFITNKNLSEMIKQHIDYVNKYLEKVENIENEIDREISYKQLGVIVLSAIEALLKTFLVEIDLRCKEKKCFEKCSYRLYNEEKEMKSISIREAIRHLNNTRCFWIDPTHENKLDILIEKRNYAHLSKYIEDSDENSKFDKKIVEDLLDYYYELLWQFDLNEWYFLNKEKCLKILDENGYELTKKFNNSEKENFYTQKLSLLLDKAYHKIDLDFQDYKMIKKIKKIEKNSIDKVVRGALNLFIIFGTRGVDKDNFYNELNRKLNDTWLSDKMKEVTKENEKNVKCQYYFNQKREY